MKTIEERLNEQLNQQEQDLLVLRGENERLRGTLRYQEEQQLQRESALIAGATKYNIQNAALADLDKWISGRILYFVSVNHETSVEILSAYKGDSGIGVFIDKDGEVDWRVRVSHYETRSCSMVFLDRETAIGKAHEIVRGLLESEKDNGERLALVVKSAARAGLAVDQKYLDALRVKQREKLDDAVVRAEAELAKARKAVGDFVAGTATP